MVGVRVDCYANIYPGYKQRFPDAHFEFLTGRNPYDFPSPLAPPGMLLHAATAVSGRWAPGWTQEKFDKAYFQFLQSPLCKARLKVLYDFALTKLVFLVGLKADPRVFGRTLVKQLIEKLGAEKK